MRVEFLMQVLGLDGENVDCSERVACRSDSYSQLLTAHSPDVKFTKYR